MKTLLDTEPSERIDPRALKAWFFAGILKGLVILLIPVIYLVKIKDIFQDLPDVWAWVGIGVIIVYTIWDAIIAPQLRIRFWRYEIREDEIDIQHGIFIIRRTLIPKFSM